MNINELVKAAHANAIDKGWYEEPRSFGDKIALIHSEVSEALEDHRNGNNPQTVWYEIKDTDGQIIKSNLLESEKWKPCGIPSELADIVIRVADMCGYYGIDLEKAISEKMAYNATRPHRHGGKKL
ncbi:hypothetical protein WMW72_35260 [Paenibacillus filicis]|uniref:NTP pyrophosphohydrolase MazG putative catalytic core domain-containing protein n=1 Tax=Paenibacillus filicis TaxID=669464 RepID=A0ABU9DW73_9BACL